MTNPITQTFTLTGQDVYRLEEITRPIKGLFLKDLNRSATWRPGIGKDDNGNIIYAKQSNGYAAGYLIQGKKLVSYSYQFDGGKYEADAPEPSPYTVDQLRPCEVEAVKVDLAAIAPR